MMIYYFLMQSFKIYIKLSFDGEINFIVLFSQQRCLFFSSFSFHIGAGNELRAIPRVPIVEVHERLS